MELDPKRVAFFKKYFPEGKEIETPIDSKEEQDAILKYIHDYNVECKNPDHGYGQFSGGCYEEYYIIEGQEYALTLVNGVLEDMVKIRRKFY